MVRAGLSSRLWAVAVLAIVQAANAQPLAERAQAALDAKNK